MKGTISFLALVLFAMEAKAQCVAPKGWFPHETANLQPDFHAPSSNCEFHMGAWQTFLWLTQVPDPTKNPDRIRLFDMPTADSLFLPGRAPATLNALTIDRFKKQPLLLKPRVAQTEASTPFSDIRQAGSKGLLVDQNGRAVYYASHVSPIFYQFVRSNRLYIKDIYVKAPPTLNFPVGSIELKSSWRIVATGEDTSTFFTTDALINPLVCNNGVANCMGNSVVVDLSRTEKVKVALVGLHIVVVLEDHPEALWATFEHIRNAPDLSPGIMPNNPVSDQNFTFYSANTLSKDCNLPNAMTVGLDVKKNQLSPVTNVFRQFAFWRRQPNGHAEHSGPQRKCQGSTRGKVGLAELFPGGWSMVWCSQRPHARSQCEFDSSQCDGIGANL